MFVAPGGELIQRDKTINDNYYPLTLAKPIAKEIRQQAACRPNVLCALRRACH
ncbi:hypothetical protein [Gemmiger formicilis]|uniref:hypothetical protein n=1 Tax=Gemmiger formicilis TaxID=745368 RepID=UPI00399AA43B